MKRAKIEKGFKVTCSDSSGRHSAIHIVGSANYFVGKWTRPRKGCGPLCVFASAEAAKYFNEIYGEDGFEVWGCLFERSRGRKAWIGGTCSTLKSLPGGTVLARRVKLVRKLVRQ